MKKITFRKFLLIYTLVLAALMGCFLIYVVDSLLKYEHNQLDNYMADFIADLKDADRDIPADASVKQGLAYLAKSGVLTCQQDFTATDASHPVFTVYNGDEALLQVTLASRDLTTRLGLLTFNIWKDEKVKLLKTDGLFSLTISVPNSYTVEVDGRRLGESDYAEPEQYAGLAALSQQVAMAYEARYLVKGLNALPDVKITDDKGQAVACEMKGTQLSIAVPCQKIVSEAEARDKIADYPDVIGIARQWSLYLSNDLAGTHNGFDTIKAYLVEGTYLYQYAYNWSVSVDRKFVSPHGFARERFSEEKVCNFEVYSAHEFSCDMFLQKNMMIFSRPLPDKMGERMHFVRYDATDDGQDNPQWKLVSMKSITKE